VTIEDADAASTAEPRRPVGVVIFFVLYLLVAGLCGYLALGYGRGDVTPLQRALLGAGTLVLLVACAGILLREPWVRRLCVALHAVLIVVVVVYGIATWPEDQDVSKPMFRVIGAAGFQLGFIATWTREDVVRWFAPRAAAS
jgi:hypothetical protein